MIRNVAKGLWFFVAIFQSGDSRAWKFYEWLCARSMRWWFAKGSYSLDLKVGIGSAAKPYQAKCLEEIWTNDTLWVKRFGSVGILRKWTIARSKSNWVCLLAKCVVFVKWNYLATPVRGRLGEGPYEPWYDTFEDRRESVVLTWQRPLSAYDALTSGELR